MTSSSLSRRAPSGAAIPLIAALVLATIAWPTSARGQAESAPPLTESMEVVLVNVEVWVYDKDDVPVRGLTAADFEILEDGVPVPITHFAEIQAGGANARRLQVQLPATQQASPASPAPTAPVTEESPNLVLYFDQLHLSPTSTRRLAGDLKTFLASGPTPSDQVLIIRQGFDLFTEAGFGSTREQLDAALDRIAKSPSLAPVDSRAALSRLQDAWNRARELPNPCLVFSIDAKGEIATYLAQAQRSSAATLENLRRTASMLAALPGHKTMLFVSDSMETRPGAELVRFASNTCGGERELSELAFVGESVQLSRLLQGFSDEANRNRITVYPFQASGLRPSSAMGPEQAQFDIFTHSGVDSLMRSVNREGLLELARQTGGWAVVDRNRFAKELERLGTDMTTYYSLGYTPRRPGSTANHSIDVRTKGTLAKYTRLRHRLSYRDKEPADVLQDRLEGAVAFGAMRNPLGVRIAAGTLGQANAGSYGMPLHVLVPAAGIAFLPQQKGDQASIKVSILASNPKSRQRVKLEETFNPVRPPSTTELLDLRMVLQLSEGVHVVAVAVRDEVTGESSVVSTTVAIHDPDVAAPRPSRR